MDYWRNWWHLWSWGFQDHILIDWPKRAYFWQQMQCAALVCWSKSTTVIKWRSNFWRWQKINLLGKHTAIKIEKTKKAQIILEAVYISKRERLHVRGGRILLVLNHCQSLRIQSYTTYWKGFVKSGTKRTNSK